MNADRVGNLATAVSAPGARQTRAAALAQTGDKLAMQFASGLSVDGSVNDFLEYMTLGLIREGSAQGTDNLLRQLIPVAHCENQASTQSIYMELGDGSPSALMSLVGELRHMRGVA